MLVKKLYQSIKSFGANNSILATDYSNHSIAIVGNAGGILDQHYGKTIDSYDYVMRFHNAPTKGFEEQVGSKTSCRFVSCRYFDVPFTCKQELKKLKDTFPAFDERALLKLQDISVIAMPKIQALKYHKLLENIRSKNNEIVILPQELVSICKKYTGEQPTSGFLGIMIGLACFSQVACFGFSFYSEAWSKKHYYEEVKPNKQHHNFSKEKDLITILAENNAIEFFPC